VKAFRVVGLSLPVDGSFDDEISIKGIDDNIFIEGIKVWSLDEPVDDENDMIELDMSKRWNLRGVRLLISF
jgi:hypothetical protein